MAKKFQPIYTYEDDITEDEVLEVVKKYRKIRFENIHTKLVLNRFTGKVTPRFCAFVADTYLSYRQFIWGLAHKNKVKIESNYDVTLIKEDPVE